MGLGPRFFLTRSLLTPPNDGDERWTELEGVLRQLVDTQNANVAIYTRTGPEQPFPIGQHALDLLIDTSTGAFVWSFWSGTDWVAISFASFVGASITDDQHGARGRLTSTAQPLHTSATGSEAGFISASDKTKLDTVASGATNNPLSNDTPQPLGSAASGVDTESSRSDHVHSHGDLGGGSLHAVATTSVAGFQSAADKVKQDNFRTPQTGIVPPTTTEFPNSGDYGAFRDTNLGVTYWCTNISGTLYTVVMV